RTFVFDADHPAVLVGQDHGPTPAEFVLHALAACITSGLANIAAARRVRLTEVRSTVTGDIDLNGILGLNADVRNGYEKITVRFTIKGDAPAEKLREIVEQSRARSAVYDVITNGVPVAIEVETPCRSARALRPAAGQDPRRSPVPGLQHVDLGIVRSTMHHVGVRFGDCELSVERIELRRAGQIVDMEPQVFDVLAYLLRHRERLVPKTELLDQIWGNRFVSESALSSRIKSARRAGAATGKARRFIQPFSGRGYRFVADATEPPATAGRAAA